MPPAPRRLRRVGLVPDSESDDDGGTRVLDTPLPSSEPIDLSDDEEIMASSPPRDRIPQHLPEARHPMEEILNSRGVRPRTEWLQSCLSELEITQPGVAGLPVARQAELCFGQFLMADFNVAGAASLPPAVHSLHNMELPGPFVLQVDEIVNISQSLRHRYHESSAGSSRVLKLSMTDGVQRVSGFEYRPIRDLQVFSPAGMKITLRNVCVKRGLLVLVPEVLEVLGGAVEHLESARLRAVQVINKPPRGRRTPRGSVEPSLAETATRAAWVDNSEGSVTAAGNNDRPHRPTDQAVSNNPQGTRPSNGVSNASVHHLARGEAQQGPEHRNVQHGRPTQSSGHSAQVSDFQQPNRSTAVHQSGQQQPLQQDRLSHPGEQSPIVSRSRAVRVESRAPAGHHRTVEQHEEVHVNSNLNMSSVHIATVEHMQQVHQQTTVLQQGQRTESRRESVTNTLQERTSTPVSSESNRRLSLQSRRLVQSKLPTRPRLQAVEQRALSTDAADVITPIDLDASQEDRQNTPAESRNPPLRVDAFQDGIPFTYLSTLKDRTNSQCEQAGMVRGRIKCVITGVNNFQYKDVDEFKLHIHIEDGSLATTAFVQHQLVQRLVGYSPQEVISGLKDPQTHKEMRDKMIQFQKLLERFEGMIEVELSDASSVPIVLEMTEGLQLADVALLLDRVHQQRCMQTPNKSKLVPTIDLSTPP